MWTILLKITIIWLLLLLAYFMLLSKEKAPYWNRAFLWLALISGIAIPFIENPFLSVQPAVQTVTQVIAPVNNVTADNAPITASEVANETSSWNRTLLLTYLWLTGAVVQVVLLLKNAGQLYFLKKFSTKSLHPIANFYSNKNTPAAFSFGKLIYLPEVTYPEKELQLILQHEQQHARHKHWMDNTILELLQIVLWFHPLFYVFKKQIKLVHEYEVDQKIGPTDQYDYARLLLAQNTKAYPDKLIHRFNFSPLKNRIAMMTNTKKVSTWKYFLALPALALCFGLMSAGAGSDQRIRKGNITTFRGNYLEWETGVGNAYQPFDPMTRKKANHTINHEDQILKVNGHFVKQLLRKDIAGKFEFPDPILQEMATNFEKAVHKRKDELPKNIGYIQIYNLVVDKDLNVYYYDISTTGCDVTDTTLAGLNKLPEVNKVIDEILNDKKLINPGNQKLDRGYYSLMLNAAFTAIAFRVK